MPTAQPTIARERDKAPALAPLLALAWLLAVGGPASADLVGHGGPVRSVAASPDGGTAVSGGFDHGVLVWDTGTEAEAARLVAHEAPVNGVALTRDGRTAVSAGDDGLLAVWDVAARSLARGVRAGARLAAVALSPDEALAAAACWDGRVRLVRLADGAEVGGIRLPEGERANAVAFVGQGRVAAAGHLGTVRVADAGPGGAAAPALEWRAHGLGVTALATAGGTTLATGSVDRTVRVWDAGTGERRHELAGHDAPVTALAFSPNGGRWLASGSVDGQVVLWDPGQGRAHLAVRAHAGPVWGLAFAGPGELLSAGADGVVRRWSVPAGERLGRAAETPAARRDVPPGLERGAAAFRACAACHSLEPGGAAMAGPTFHGLLGRRAGSVPGYPYSRALAESGITWTEETVGRLFEVGPEALTPGSTMPLQRLPDPADRAALVAYLRAVTGTTASP